MVKDTTGCCIDLGIAGKSVRYVIHTRASKSSRNALGQSSSATPREPTTVTLLDMSAFTEGPAVVVLEMVCVESVMSDLLLEADSTVWFDRVDRGCGGGEEVRGGVVGAEWCMEMGGMLGYSRPRHQMECIGSVFLGSGSQKNWITRRRLVSIAGVYKG